MNPFSEIESVTKPADYIGSFLVTGKGHHERAEIVRQKLEAARLYTHSKPILLLISLSGIKVCHESNKHIYMAHALRRISYATCDPDHLQFAFLAREPKAQPNVQYCHAFVTTSPEAAEELNTIMGEAFRLAYMQQRLTVLSNLNPVLTQPNVSSTSLHSAGNNACIPQSESTIQTPVAAESNAQPSVNENRTPASTSCEDRNSTCNATPISVSNKPLPPLPCNVTTPTCSLSGQIGDNVAGSKPHGHKSHRHRSKHHHHRHKQRDAATTTNDGSGQHPSSIVVNNDVSVGMLSKTNVNGTQQCVGQNPLLSCSNVLSSSKQLACISDNSMDQPHLTNGKSTADAGPTITNLQFSQHFYDTAAHPCCEAQSVESNFVSTTDVTTILNMTLPATTTTSSSTTGGCSTTTSGSGCFGSSSDNSLPGSSKQIVGGTAANDMEHNSALLGHSCAKQQHQHHHYQQRSHITVHSPNDAHSTSFMQPNNLSGQVSQAPNVVDETNELAHASWYQPNISRDKALEILANQPRGSFVIRDSGSHANCYALSVRSGEKQDKVDVSAGILSGQKLCQTSSSGRTPTTGICTYPLTSGATTATGVSHFLIQRTSHGGFKLKGLEKEWPSLSCLVLHLTVMPEMLPCLLRLPKASANPLFVQSGHRNAIISHPSNFEQSPGLSNATHFRSISDSVNRVATDSTSLDEALASHLSDEDEDYQRLSDFSSIMADLRLRTRTTAH